MISGKLFGYIVIEATYDDRLAANTRRVSQHAIQLTQITFSPPKLDGQNKTPAQFTAMLVNVGKHNCADDECPK